MDLELKIRELVKKDVIVSPSLMVSMEDELFLLASQSYEASTDVAEKSEVDCCDVVTDQILLQASQKFEEKAVPEEFPKAMGSTRFGKPVSLDELESVRVSGIPSNTRRNTEWALRVWSEWAAERRKLVEETEKLYPLLEQFSELTSDSMCFG